MLGTVHTKLRKPFGITQDAYGFFLLLAKIVEIRYGAFYKGSHESCRALLFYLYSEIKLRL